MSPRIPSFASHRPPRWYFRRLRLHLPHVPLRWPGAWIMGLWLTLAPPAAASPASAHDDGELAHLQRQALRHAQLDLRSQRQLTLSLRLSALLPQIRATVGRGTQWIYSSRSDSYNEPVQDGDRISYSLSASWDLGRLLFAREQIALRRDAQRTADRRTQLLIQVADLYARRCQLELRRGHSPPPSAAAERSDDAARSALDGQAAALDIALAALGGDEAHGPVVTRCPKRPLAPQLRQPLPRLPADDERPADEDSSDPTADPGSR